MTTDKLREAVETIIAYCDSVQCIGCRLYDICHLNSDDCPISTWDADDLIDDAGWTGEQK